MKDWNSARGARIECPNFEPCPLCFGCRNYDESVIRCEACYDENKKKNICNTQLHTEHALNLMLQHKNKAWLRKEKTRS